LIQYLLKKQHKVIVAGNRWQLNYLTKTFPGIETLLLSGYEIRYPKDGRWFSLNILKQLPKLLRSIKQENIWLREQCEQLKVDAVISDNRYGLYHPSIPTVIMTHQLAPKTGLGILADRLFKFLHDKQLKKFSKCWVVDVAGEPNLSGDLGHPSSTNNQIEYLGLLSQFSDRDSLPKSKEHLLILLSGPEPQRTILSKMLWQQVIQLKQPIVFVEGSHNAIKPDVIPYHIAYYQQLIKEDLLPILNKASMVVCRSGYSTLMDLVAVDKKAILIPTPGQAEQEYLAKKLNREGVFYSSTQQDFQLAHHLVSVEKFPFNKINLKYGLNQYQNVLDTWLNDLP